MIAHYSRATSEADAVSRLLLDPLIALHLATRLE
jgi:hypothetical protein